MSEQLDLEIDATGVAEQVAWLAHRAMVMSKHFLLSYPGSLSITDDSIVALCQQAAAVQRLLDIINQRKKGG